MKATGIVRRIDNLGRIVIPKEIRRVLRLSEGEPLEIYTSNEGEIIFKKYSPLGEFKIFANSFCDALSKTTNVPIIITDKEMVISCFGVPKKEFIDKRISMELLNVINQRKEYQQENEIVHCIEENEKQVIYSIPLLIESDIYGSINIVGDSKIEVTSSIKGLILYTSNLMIKLIEEK